MNINGLIMQKCERRLYQGVDGNNWYLNQSGIKELDTFFDDNIEKAWGNDNYVDVCNDIEYICRYVDESKKKNIKYRIIACITEKKLPKMVLSTETDMIFLGYDYAYSGGSYYSAVLNDIISKRIQQFSSIKLNSFGLFESHQEIMDFINLRRYMKKKECNQEEYLEEGDFITYKLYELKI